MAGKMTESPGSEQMIWKVEGGGERERGEGRWGRVEEEIKFSDVRSKVVLGKSCAY